jgi:hypothetical protein
MTGVDSLQPLSGAALAAAGIGFAGRYLKNLTPDEATDLRSHGVALLLLGEVTNHDLTGSAATAVTIAGTGDTEAVGLGAPSGSAVVMCDDENDPFDQSTVVADMTGASGVIRRAGFRAAYYGAKATARLLLGASVIDVTYVVDTWGADEPGDAWNFVQLPDAGQIALGGVTCDQDSAPHPLGLWLPVLSPPVPLPPVQSYPEDHMQRVPLTVVLDGNGNGYGDLTAVPFAGVVSVFPNGADPQSLQRYTPIPRVSPLQEGTGTRVVVEGGPPGGSVLVFVAVAD